MVLTVVVLGEAAGYSQPASESGGAESFFAGLPGDWVGTVSQSTDGEFGDTKYFHAAIKQTSLGVYASVFTYYRLDEKSGAPVLVGVSGMATEFDTAGTATNSVTGKGDILVDANTRKPETHALTELLRESPTGGLQGTGSGSISVTGMPLGLGKSGRIRGYFSTWSMRDDVLSISQRFTVEFRILVFRKSYTITADFTATRGSDILGLMKAAGSGGPGR